MNAWRMCVPLLASLGLPLSAAAQAPIWGETNLINSTDRSLWVTVYIYESMPRKVAGISTIYTSFCMPPGDKSRFNVDVSKVGTHRVRGELTHNANCQQPVACDREVEITAGDWDRLKSKYEFRATPGSCGFQHLKVGNRMGDDPETLDWKQQLGAATDIGVGANGAKWVIGNDPHPGGNYGIYKWSGSNWSKIDGHAVRIAVDPQGNAWVVNSGNNIYRYTGSGWTQVDGAARDIGVGGDGSVWIIGNDRTGNDYGIHKFNGSGWTKTATGGGVRIAVDQNGAPWILNSTNDAFKYIGPGWVHYPGKGKDIGAGGGAVFIVGLDGTPYRFDGGGGWTRQSGVLTDIAVDQTGRPCGVNPSRQIWCVEPAPPKDYTVRKGKGAGY